MRQSAFFQKTIKNISKDEVSRNAQLLTKAGFINQLMAGVYTFLPPGLKVLTKIENIIREEMNAIGGQEILMPALQPRENWDKTDRWDMDILFRLKGHGERDYCLGPTHEEVVTPLGLQHLKSYKDLPVYVYQIQTKFRNEVRAKSGLLRGREFRMKDLYSFHASQECIDTFYEKATEAYHNIFRRCGIGDKTILTYASGGAFAKYSHEFQTITEYGEDTIYLVPGKNIAINKEIIDDEEALRGIVSGYQKGDEKNFEQVKAIETGNIFKLGTRFSNAFGGIYTDQDGQQKPFIMGCYGIGPSRLMGTVVEVLSDENGMVWPKEIAPYDAHLISLVRDEDEISQCDTIYETLLKNGIDVLYDDRQGVSAGAKFSDSDLMGIPERIVISTKTLKDNMVEWKSRTSKEAKHISLEECIKLIKG